MEEEKRNKLISKKNGFTLIELLVVVLIIGILAAIALPQYKQAVFNSRMKKVEIIMAGLQAAYMEYQLINGKGTTPTNANQITWGLPDGCTRRDGFQGGSNWAPAAWTCDGFQLVIKKDGSGEITAADFFGSLGGGGWLDKMPDGSFRCRYFGTEQAKNFKKYCVNNNYLLAY
jgi:prepilin-type N-terminal cleavage/methylation domain-containing protein